MKISDLIKIIEQMRGNYADTEQKLMDCRNQTNTGITVAEVEARAGFQVCNCVIGHIEHFALSAEIEPEVVAPTVSATSDEHLYWRMLIRLGFGSGIAPEDQDLAGAIYERWSKVSGKTAANVAFGEYPPPG